jgi:hypothetical protein
LCLVLDGLPLAQPDVSEERRGPKVGAAAQALDGFLKANGVTLADLAERDTPKGRFYFLDVAKKGRATALVLAELIFERLWTIRRGRPDDPPRGLAYADLDPDHPFRGTILDRVIVGQRLGRILGQPDYRPFFHDRLAACLAVAIENTHDEDLIAACLQERHLRPGWLVASRLRAAPALGAAIAAVQRWSVPV